MKRTADGLIATSIRTLGDVRVHRPRSIREAAEIVAAAEPPAMLLAGGTDVVAQCNEGRVPPQLVALPTTSELTAVRIDDETLHVGAMVTHAAASGSETVDRCAPGLAAAWRRIANVRVRFSATLGGNVMARRTRYELPILFAALETRLRFTSALDGECEIPAGEEPPPLAVLTAARLPLRGLLAFDYDRSLRPVMTQAVALRRARDGTVRVRCVLGTEAMLPHVLAFAVDAPATLRRDAADLASHAFAALPASAHDHLTSNRYLRRAGSAQLARALGRFADVL